MKLRLLFISLFLIPCVANSQTLGSCHIFPSNNPWNERIDSLPVHWNSAKYIANVGGAFHVHPDFGSNASYGIPWVAVNASQPFVPIDLSNGYTDESDPGPMPIPPNAPVEGGGVGDAHVLVVDTSNHHLYELYQGVKGSGSGWAATSSAIFALDSNKYRPDGWTSCDAAGLPIFPGLVRLDECKAGVINHALRFTVPHTQKAWIFPARHEAGSTSDTTVMPMGLRMRLKAKFDDSKDTGYAKVIITALKKYGIILADNGSSWFISGETNIHWPDNDINQLKAITGNDFEAVYTGPVRTKPNEYPDPVLPLPNAGGIVVPSIVRDTARVGDANAAPIAIANNGSNVLTIRRYWLKYGDVFQIADSGTHSIAAGGNAAVTINFMPIVKGQVVDTLFIASSDSLTPVTATALIGWGTMGAFHLSVNPLDLGTVAIGSSDTLRVTVTNFGDGELDVFSNDRTGTDPADFSLIAVRPQPSPPFILMPGDTEMAEFRFHPVTLGPDTSIFAFSFADTLSEEYDTSLVLVGRGVAASAVDAAQPEPFDVAIFPNPSPGLTTVSISGSDGPSQIEASDALGRTVLKEIIASETGMLDFRSLANGCYFLLVQSSRGQMSKLLEVVH